MLLWLDAHQSLREGCETLGEPGCKGVAQCPLQCTKPLWGWPSAQGEGYGKWEGLSIQSLYGHQLQTYVYTQEFASM